MNDVTADYNSYRFNRIFRRIYEYCSVELSSIYLDISKDTLYCEHPNSKKRRSCQTAIYRILYGLITLIAPILSFTAEEAYSHIPEREKESVFLEEFPPPCEKLDQEILEKWNRLIEIKGVVNKALEEARKKGTISHSLEAAVKIYADGKDHNLLKAYEQELPFIFITSQATVLPLSEAPEYASGTEELQSVKVVAEKARGKKCQRCWMYSETVGQDSKYPDVCQRCAKVLRELEG